MFDLDYLKKIAQRSAIDPRVCWCDTARGIDPRLLGHCRDLINDPLLWSKEDARTFWQIVMAEPEYYRSDPFIQTLVETFAVDSMSLLYTQPWTSVRVHTDTERLVALNCVLTTNSPATTYFNTSDRRPDQYHLAEVPMTPMHYYLINTQVPHGVLNRDGPRLMLSLSFNKIVDYEMVYRWLENQNAAE